MEAGTARVILILSAELQEELPEAVHQGVEGILMSQGRIMLWGADHIFAEAPSESWTLGMHQLLEVT